MITRRQTEAGAVLRALAAQRALPQVASRRPGTLQPLAARVGGVDIPNQKKVEFSLQYIYGIGPVLAKDILQQTVRLRPARLLQAARRRKAWAQLRGALLHSCSAHLGYQFAYSSRHPLSAAHRTCLRRASTTSAPGSSQRRS